MLWRIFQKLEPTILSLYRKVAAPPPPNLVGDRNVEYTWIATKMPHGPGTALEVGCGSSYMGLLAARRGFCVLAIDVAEVQWPYSHPNLSFLRGDVLELDLEPESFDLMINCSTLEHIGLGRYGDQVHEEGDLRAMQRLNRFLRATGFMLLTIPVGKDANFPQLHRVYGRRRLPAVLEGYRISDCEYWVKDANNRWVQAPEELALDQVSKPTYYGIGCFLLTKG